MKPVTSISTYEPGRSVSMVSHYGLEDLTFGVRASAETKDLSTSLCVQTAPAAHPVSYPVGTGGPFPGIKLGQGVILTTHPI
jgi:hypothetical protein